MRRARTHAASDPPQAGMERAVGALCMQHDLKSLLPIHREYQPTRKLVENPDSRDGWTLTTNND
ncbi:MAG TPA: hypothetical protein VFE38_08045 [Edaphobacter sp.]|nr:hypothetical protein [Edaphobacter sp.]